MEFKDFKVAFKEAFDKAYQETVELEQSILRFAELIKHQEQNEVATQMIQTIQEMKEMQEKLKNPSNLYFEYFDWSWSSFGLMSYILRKMLSQKRKTVSKPYKPDFIEVKLTLLLPEEWQADLNTLRQRWIKKRLSPREIRFLTYKYLFHAILGLITVKIENYWLPNRNSEKDIE